jgi:cytochrome c-type biogenesis protein CcmH/NrfF
VKARGFLFGHPLLAVIVGGLVWLSTRRRQRHVVLILKQNGEGHGREEPKWD